MTTRPRQPQASDDWESLSPWQKAREWQKEAPEIADRVMELATRRAEHRWKLEVRHAEHEQLMDKRLWWTQLIGILGGVVSVMIFGAVSLQYAAAGDIVPGLAALGLGTGATAGGIYGVRRSTESLRKQMRSPSSAPAVGPPNS
jgi:hypothetical protein